MTKTRIKLNLTIVALDTHITYVTGIGPATSNLYKKLKIETVFDLLDHWPRRYDDYSTIQKIRAIKPGTVTVRGVLKQAKGRYVRKGMHITEAVLSDESGSVRLFWFNQPYRAESLKSGQEYFVSGVFELSHQRLQITSPSVELVSDFPIHTARIVPIYKETKGLKSTSIRRAIRTLIPSVRLLPETLPEWILAKYSLMSRSDAVEQIHLPSSPEHLALARRRMGFEEVFRACLASLLNRKENDKDKGYKITFDEILAKQFVASLAFQLTDAQRRVVWQIYKDMAKSSPMNRLVEGDVGSGKTVVAVMAALMALKQGYQVALMAPTEILARQHADSIHSLMGSTDYQQSVSLLIGGQNSKHKKSVKLALEDGSAKFIIGTHALLQSDVVMQNLGLVVIDEQHRFGVQQRKALQSKARRMPHVLSLSATPIPRSLALTLYGELDISVLDQMPTGRQGIETSIFDFGAYAETIAIVKRELKEGRQVFVVCPAIKDDEGVRSVDKVYFELTKTLKDYVVGLLHGQLTSTEKESIMQDFVAHKVDVLVSTTVIEVGVDVPNASVMMIESAERFGLAQLHQLRGRVGRGYHKGYCLLVTSPNMTAGKRLLAMEQINDGFKLAELDLQLRGPGAIYGAMQHGALDLRVANLGDIVLINEARQAATEFIEKGNNLIHYKELASSVNKLRTITNLN